MRKRLGLDLQRLKDEAARGPRPGRRKEAEQIARPVSATGPKSSRCRRPLRASRTARRAAYLEVSAGKETTDRSVGGIGRASQKVATRGSSCPSAGTQAQIPRTLRWSERGGRERRRRRAPSQRRAPWPRIEWVAGVSRDTLRNSRWGTAGVRGSILCAFVGSGHAPAARQRRGARPSVRAGAPRGHAAPRSALARTLSIAAKSRQARNTVPSRSNRPSRASRRPEEDAWKKALRRAGPGRADALLGEGSRLHPGMSGDMPTAATTRCPTRVSEARSKSAAFCTRAPFPRRSRP